MKILYKVSIAFPITIDYHDFIGLSSVDTVDKQSVFMINLIFNQNITNIRLI